MDNAKTQVNSPKGHQKADFYICEFMRNEAKKQGIKLPTRGSRTLEQPDSHDMDKGKTKTRQPRQGQGQGRQAQDAEVDVITYKIFVIYTLHEKYSGQATGLLLGSRPTTRPWLFKLGRRSRVSKLHWTNNVFG